jgi:UDP-glucuronate 4-epimerase
MHATWSFTMRRWVTGIRQLTTFYVMKPKHVLVTGGAGFIGSHLVERLASEGAQVVVADNFDPFYDTSIKRANFSACSQHAAIRLVEVDIRDLAEIRRQLEGPYDAIVHLAAKAGVQPSIVDPAAYYDTNVRGTQNLLELARELEVPQFIFASSSSVYGANPNIPWSESDHVLLPISPYASTKVSGELMGHVYSHLYGIRFVALRFFTVYGPRQRPDLAIHKFARLMLQRMPIQLYGDGTTMRDYTYIDDIIAGTRAALDYTDSMYEVINLGNNCPMSLAEMLHELEEALGVEAHVQLQSEQPGDVRQTYADIRKARQLLGYAPITTFRTGLRQFVDWLKSEGRALPYGIAAG